MGLNNCVIFTYFQRTLRIYNSLFKRWRQQLKKVSHYKISFFYVLDTVYESLKKLRIKKWSCLANKEKRLDALMIIHCPKTKLHLKSKFNSRQDRDRSTSEDFDLEKLGRCAKASHSLCDASKKRAVGDGCVGGMEVRWLTPGQQFELRGKSRCLALYDATMNYFLEKSFKNRYDCVPDLQV